MKNIFDGYEEFIDLDNRRLRKEFTTSKQSLYHKLLAQIPPDEIKNKTILDLGSCLGAAGHYSMMLGAASYTGVEIQDYYVQTSNHLLEKHWANKPWKIVKEDVYKFLDDSIEQNIKYDIVLASGIIYGFLNIIDICQKICKVSSDQVVIDTKYVTNTMPNIGIILLISNDGMPNSTSKDSTDIKRGLSSRIDLIGLDFVMKSEGFDRVGDIIKPIPITDADDPYNNEMVSPSGYKAIGKYIAKYKKSDTQLETLHQAMTKNHE